MPYINSDSKPVNIITGCFIRKSTNSSKVEKINLESFKKDGFKSRKQREFIRYQAINYNLINWDLIRFYLDAAKAKHIPKIKLIDYLRLTDIRKPKTAMKILNDIYLGRYAITLHILINFSNYFKVPVDTFLVKNTTAITTQVDALIPDTLIWPADKRIKHSASARNDRIKFAVNTLLRAKAYGYNVSDVLKPLL